MELKQLWTVIRRRWWLILLPAVVALVLSLSAIKTMIRPPVTYNVTVHFTASQTPTDSTSGTYQDKSYTPWLASEYVVTNLSTWMRTQSFAHEIALALQSQNKQLDEDAIRGAIQSDSARSIMTLYVTWPDPDEIKLIAQAGSDVLRTKNAAYFPEFGNQVAQVTPLDAIVVTPVSTPIANRLAPLVRILIGLAAGIALAFLAEYLDPAIRNRQEVEALNLPVIAEIPHH